MCSCWERAVAAAAGRALLTPCTWGHSCQVWLGRMFTGNSPGCGAAAGELLLGGGEVTSQVSVWELSHKRDLKGGSRTGPAAPCSVGCSLAAALLTKQFLASP